MASPECGAEALEATLNQGVHITGLLQEKASPAGSRKYGAQPEGRAPSPPQVQSIDNGLTQIETLIASPACPWALTVNSSSTPS